jgi:hypothetical protein
MLDFGQYMHGLGGYMLSMCEYMRTFSEYMRKISRNYTATHLAKTCHCIHVPTLSCYLSDNILTSTGESYQTGGRHCQLLKNPHLTLLH